MILNWVNGALGSPVDVASLGKGLWGWDDVSLVVRWELETSVLGNKFGFSEVGELVVSQNVVLLLEVFSIDLGISLGENSKSVEVFLWTGVLDLVFNLPCIECLDDIGTDLGLLSVLLDKVEA